METIKWWSFLLLVTICMRVNSQQSFIMQLNEEVNVMKHMPATACFNKSLSNKANITGSEEFLFSRGILLSINYETISSPLTGTSRISMKAEFQCCSFYCTKFGRLLNTGQWMSGTINLDVVDETSVGIYHKKVQVCHASYLKGIFGKSLTVSPFTLEGSENECLIKKADKTLRAYTAVGVALRVSAVEVGTSSIVVYFGFLLTNWSKSFMLKLMREGEHGTLVNVNAAIFVKQEPVSEMPFTKLEICFGAVTVFCFSVVLLAALMLVCTKSKRVFLQQTCTDYEAHLKLEHKQSGHTVANQIALEELL